MQTLDVAAVKVAKPVHSGADQSAEAGNEDAGPVVCPQQDAGNHENDRADYRDEARRSHAPTKAGAVGLGTASSRVIALSAAAIKASTMLAYQIAS